MKKVLLSFALAALMLPLSAQVTTFPWNYDFSDSTQSMNDWTFHYLVVTDTNDNTGAVDTFYYSYEWVGSEGHNAPGCVYNYLSVGSMMVTPALQIPADAANFALSFWSINEVFSYYGFYNFAPAYKVLVSTTTNDSAAFTTELLSDEAVHDWEFKTVSLDAYAGQTIYLAFLLTDDGYNFIDDITVGSMNEPVYTVSGSSFAQTGEAVNLSATYIAGDQTNMILTWSSTMAAAGQATITGANTANPTITYSAAGTDQITFTATNSYGTFTNNLTINVVHCDPIAALPWSIDFSTETIGDCWLNLDADGDGFTWKTVTFQSGETCLISESYSNNSGALNPDNWLITPKFATTAGAPLTFTWEFKAQDANYPAEKVGVYVSSTGSNPSDFTAIETFTCTADEAEWQTRSYNLDQYAGQTIRIAIRHFECTDQFYFDVKSMSLTTTTGIADVDNSAISLYPNPASNMVEVSAQGVEGRATVAIVDLNGRTLMQQEGNAASYRFDVSGLAAGAYFVRMTGENVNAVQKLIVK